MKHIVIICILFITIIPISSTPQVQTQSDNIRQAAVAGKFYSADSATLRNQVADLYSGALPKTENNVIAVIAPHAAYVYSGVVAASAFMQLEPEKEYEDIFLIGSSHSVSFDAASVYCNDGFMTPLGLVEVDTTLCKKLIEDNNCMRDYPDAHWFEHCLEVELPFLQHRLRKPFKIVPIIIGSASANTCKQIASALEPYMNEDNLFVVSTDLSHYANYKDAILADYNIISGIVSNNSATMLQAIKKNSSLGIANLATSACGWSSVLTLLYMTEGIPDLKVKELMYRNSGDSPLGDSSRVVGYCSIVFSKEIAKMKEIEFELNASDKENLLKIARQTLESYIKESRIPEIDTTDFGPGCLTKCGAFVTLKIDGGLRGCIGRFTSDLPLYKLVQSMTIASSTQDPRFDKVKQTELKDIDIEISVLSPMRKIESIDEIVMGTHGIYISKNAMTGTFLPQVADETGWSKEEFLGHCSRDKAGIGWEGWKDADIYVYTAIIISEKEKR